MRKQLYIILFLIIDLLGLSSLSHAQNIQLELEAWEVLRGYGSCPWIYCWNGSEYIADNDVYSTARSVNRKYTDYYMLQKPLVEKNGAYSLELREDGAEHSYTDMVKLMVIDHPASVRIGTDEAGNIGSYADPSPPVSAVRNGNLDIRGEVTSDDGVGASVYHQDVIVVDFGAVDVSQKALFVMKAIGFRADDNQDLGDNTYQQPNLQIQTLNSLGDWETRNVFYPREDWAWGCYDLTGLSPDSDGHFKVRIYVTSCHAKKYHSIDYIGLDTGPQEQLSVNTLAPTKAMHSNGTVVLTHLADSDNVYAEMMPGQKISMTFSKPPMNGEQRDFVFISKGYYLPINTGTYYIQTWNGSVWDTVDNATFIGSSDHVDTTHSFDMSSFLPDADGDYKIRISHRLTPPDDTLGAGIDFVGLKKDGLSGNMVSALDLGRGMDVTDKVSFSDNNWNEWPWQGIIMDTSHKRTIDIEWNWTNLNGPDYTGRFEFEGYDRKYEVYLPQNFQSNMPLVISIHGRWETIDWYKDYTVMHEYADTMGYVLVYPQGTSVPGETGYSWNAGIKNNGNYATTDDVGFISALIDTIKKSYDIDLSRVYCCGYSLGDGMTNRIAGEIGHRIAAIAGVSGPMFGLANTWTFTKPMPVLHMHGTGDTFVPYGGDGDRWPVETAIEYWVNVNGCTGPPDSVYLPDIEPEDNCTMLKISYTTCNGGSQVIFYKGINMGHSWPDSKTTFDTEGNKNLDINANVEILNFFKNHVNPLVNMAYANVPEVFPNYIPPQGDSLQICTRLVNPENHPVTVSAVIEGVKSAFKDSLPLFDDGLHGDGAAGDNLWGNKQWLSGLDLDNYTVRIPSHDMAEDINYPNRSFVSFTTSGPVVLDRFYISSSDTIVNTGDRIRYRFVLRNAAESGTIKNIKTEIVALDTFAELSTSRLIYDDLPAGETVESNGQHSIKFTEGDIAAKFELKIYSDDHYFWSDTFSVDVRPNAVEDRIMQAPKEFGLYQNYPNPFNPVTMISYQLSMNSFVEISVYNLLGQRVATLVNRKQPAGHYQVQWDARGYASGIYFYKLNTDGFQEVKKMVLLQ